MDITDRMLVSNRDWDPSYLNEIFQEDFYDYCDMWSSDLSDSAIVSHLENVEKYCPITEDITMDDDTLCSAVEQIEEE